MSKVGENFTPEKFLSTGFWNRANRLDINDCPPVNVIDHVAISDSYVRALQDRFAKEGLPDLSGLVCYQAGWELYGKIFGNHDKPAPFLEPEKIFLLKDGEDSFVKKISHARTTLPSGFQVFLGQREVKTTLGGRLEDYDLLHAGDIARGYDGLTMDYAPAFYNKFKGITVLQQHRDKQGATPKHKGAYISTCDPFFIHLHEAGHAANCADVFNFHAQLFFVEACEKDRAAFAQEATAAEMAEMQKNLRYYLPKSLGGAHKTMDDARDEAFAELFASHLAGYERYDGVLRETFSRAASAVYDFTEAFGEAMKIEPDLDAILVRRNLRNEALTAALTMDWRLLLTAHSPALAPGAGA